MRRWQWIAVGLIALACAPGCGGGGGVLSVGSLVYTVQWGVGAGGNDPQSVKITLFSGATQVAQGVIPRVSGQPTATGEFGSLAGGTYRIQADAYTSNNGTGAAFAQILTDKPVTGGLPTPFITAFSSANLSVKITPTNPTVQATKTLQLAAVLQDSIGTNIYTATNDWSWQSDATGTATITNTGLATGVSEGSAGITATNISNSKSANVTLQVTSGPPVKTKYTILVYLNAANDLDPFSTPNVNQMEFAATNADVRTVVQWKRISQFSSDWTGTRRYLVKHDNTNTINSQLLQDMGPGIDMGDWHTLRAFVDWGMANYPADHTVLVMWDHGSGWRGRAVGGGGRGVSFDDETGNHIATWELAQSTSHTPKIDLIAWDASLLQMMEVAFELKDVTSFVVGSEESPPGAGYPYDAIFGRLALNGDMSVKDFSKVFVEEMINAYGTSSNITQSSIDESKLPDLGNALTNLATLLISKKAFFTVELGNARQVSEHYGVQYGYNDYVDLYDACDEIIVKANDANLTTSAAFLQTRINNAIVANSHGDLHPKSHGLAINWSPAGSYNSNYSLLTLALFTTWDDWIKVAP